MDKLGAKGVCEQRREFKVSIFSVCLFLEWLGLQDKEGLHT